MKKLKHFTNLQLKLLWNKLNSALTFVTLIMEKNQRLENIWKQQTIAIHGLSLLLSRTSSPWSFQVCVHCSTERILFPSSRRPYCALHLATTYSFWRSKYARKIVSCNLHTIHSLTCLWLSFDDRWRYEGRPPRIYESLSASAMWRYHIFFFLLFVSSKFWWALRSFRKRWSDVILSHWHMKNPRDDLLLEKIISRRIERRRWWHIPFFILFLSSNTLETPVYKRM